MTVTFSHKIDKFHVLVSVYRYPSAFLLSLLLVPKLSL